MPDDPTRFHIGKVGRFASLSNGTSEDTSLVGGVHALIMRHHKLVEADDTRMTQNLPLGFSTMSSKLLSETLCNSVFFKDNLHVLSPLKPLIRRARRPWNSPSVFVYMCRSDRLSSEGCAHNKKKANEERSWKKCRRRKKRRRQKKRTWLRCCVANKENKTEQHVPPYSHEA
jgi:hypothetical protein